MSNSTPLDKTASSDHYVIVIGRRFGSGGRKIAQLLAKRLNIAYYDRTLLSHAAQSMGFDTTIFNTADEKRPSWMRSLLHLNYGLSSSAGEFGSINNENLYSAQSHVIKQLPEKESCVIVGRTADYVLRNHPRLLSVFLHAPLDFRINKIMERSDATSPEEATELANKIDKTRQDYYSYFTNRKWGHADTYHLSLDTSRMSADKIVDLIIYYLKSRFTNIS